jgi:hypothetical protein
MDYSDLFARRLGRSWLMQGTSRKLSHLAYSGPAYGRPGRSRDRVGHMAGIEFAWRVHQAQEQWSTRADTKATVVFTVEAAVIAAVVAAFGNTTLAGVIVGWRLVLVWLGIIASVVAIAAASIVVMPQLGRRESMEQDGHFIYFGDLRFWHPDDLAAKLTDLSEAEQIVELSVQLTRTSVGNWRKYFLLRAAVVAALIGAVILVVAFAWPR